MSPGKKLTDRSIGKLEYAGEDGSRCVAWDSLLPGFGVRITPAGGKSYVLSYRHKKKKRLLALGNVQLFKDVKAAREKARSMLLALHDRGVDPHTARHTLKASETVADLWKRYDELVIASRAQNTQRAVRSVFKVHIVPAVGTVQVAHLDAGDVTRLHDRTTTKGGKVIANRAVERLSGALAWAHKRYKTSFPADWTNPCRDVDKHTEHPRRHSLTALQLRALWNALEAERSPYIRSFIRVLMLTGARKSEVLGLRWEDVDLTSRRARLRTTKARGEDVLILPAAAADELAALPRTSSPFVFPGRDIAQPMSDARLAYKTALKRAGVPPATTLHDLRRSLGVALARSGYSAEAIAAVLRNTSNVAAKHYITIAGDLVIEATDKAATAILGRS